MNPRQIQSVTHSEGDVRNVTEAAPIILETAPGTTSSGLSCYRNEVAHHRSIRVGEHKEKSTSKGKKAGCLNKHFTPCGCESVCTKKCSCATTKICCEKYCGCSTQCKNRFRGCYCVTGLCRSKDCPCFIAERECDSDICRSCWVSCGDGPIGQPPKRKIGSCNNMNILIGRGKKIYRGRSKVAGWGAFTSEAINKDEFIGEYTGELFLHEVADKRQANHPGSSYLFDVDDQYVIDARDKGNDLRFANHSSNPNCYPKNLFTGGERRIGFFAKSIIEAGEELFIDYGNNYDAVWKHINIVEHSKDGDKAGCRGADDEITVAKANSFSTSRPQHHDIGRRKSSN